MQFSRFSARFSPVTLLLVFLLGTSSLVLLGCGGQDNSKTKEARSYFVEARRAIGSGDTAKALEALSASIESEPTTWAYLQRAKINAEGGNDQAVSEDCKAVLELDPQNRDVPWMEGELKKPKDKRFQGRFKEPPSSSK